MKSATLKHLAELRRRLIVTLVLLCVAMAGVYAVKEPLLAFLLKPLLATPNAPQTLVFSAVPELFFTYLKITVWGGVFLTLPILMYQIWRFFAPGLYKHERQAVLPQLIAAPVLFYGGGLFAYFGVLPLALKFFLGFAQEGVSALPNVTEYLGLLFNFAFGFGLAFNLPVILIILMQLGVFKPEQLASWRRFAVVAVFVVATLITPPDPFSQLMLALPLVGLYELAIVIGRYQAWQKAKSPAKPRA